MNTRRFRRVSVGKYYQFHPVGMDRYNPTTEQIGSLEDGSIVRVIELHNAPRANTMGQCYIAHEGKFIGMVCTNSLTPITDEKGAVG